ncbi:tmem87a [Symbiodinium natans]|uniref:Tmem87a protein n=1 Tax=Symbiodinium natans TaxID=878477 RepID=A0A812IFH8_9DINO|nr:tmem87a [Symbiodinium natans]
MASRQSSHAAESCWGEFVACFDGERSFSGHSGTREPHPASLHLLLRGSDARLWESEEWLPLYRDWCDGKSFNALVKGAAFYEGPALVLIRTRDSVLGALSTSWVEGNGKFGGSMECFLFALQPAFRVCKSSTRTGNYVYFNLRNKHYPRGLGFGGRLGFCRLWLDADFEDCYVLESDATYAPGRLLASQGGLQTRFDVISVEVWGCGGLEAAKAQAAQRERLESAREQARKVDKSRLCESEFDKEMPGTHELWNASAPSRNKGSLCRVKIADLAKLFKSCILCTCKVPLPEPRSLHTLYAFYVFSHQDAPERTLGQPMMRFHNLMFTATSGADAEKARGYAGVQLSILPYRSFWKLIQPDKFCSNMEDVQAGRAKEANKLLTQKPIGSSDDDVNLYSHTINFETATDLPLRVNSTGVYILVFSNCGDFKDGEVSGSVIAKNSYGFLPGNEYYKMPFYGWLSIAYCALASVWMCLSLRYWRELFHIQYCIAAVILLGLVEAFLQWRFFMDWNESGLRGRFLFVLAILATVVKSIFSYMLVLVASLGWGVTRPYLDQATILKVQGLSFLYIVLDFVRESALSFRNSHSLSITFVMLCLLPVALLNGIIFYWIFTALSSLIEILAERKQVEKLILFQRLWKILVAALSLASLSLLYQLFDLSRSISQRWHYQWFFADGVSHILFCMVLAAIMFLWAPHTNSQRYAYKQVDDQEGESSKITDSKDVWADEGGLDEEEDDSFWASTHKSSNVKADILGGPTQAADGDND